MFFCFFTFKNLVYESSAENANIKIIDFGFAQIKSETEGLSTPCFTLNYAAPEVLKRAMAKQGTYNEACDLWSLGVVMVCEILYTLHMQHSEF